MRLSHVGRLTPRSDARRRSQAGETLIEVLTTVVLMGIGFTAVISAIFTAVRVAEINQRYTKASILVQTFAETLAQPAKDPTSSSPAATLAAASLYIPCASPSGPGSYADAGISPPRDAIPTGWTADVVKVEYFTGWATPLPGLKSATWSTNQSACMSLSQYAASPSRDNGLQRITIQVKNNNAQSPVTDTIVLVKRDRRCPDQFNNADLGPC